MQMLMALAQVEQRPETLVGIADDEIGLPDIGRCRTETEQGVLARLADRALDHGAALRVELFLADENLTLEELLVHDQVGQIRADRHCAWAELRRRRSRRHQKRRQSSRYRQRSVLSHRIWHLQARAAANQCGGAAMLPA